MNQMVTRAYELLTRQPETFVNTFSSFRWPIKRWVMQQLQPMQELESHVGDESVGHSGHESSQMTNYQLW